jgi:hypothetical protein
VVRHYFASSTILDPKSKIKERIKEKRRGNDNSFWKK